MFSIRQSFNLRQFARYYSSGGVNSAVVIEHDGKTVNKASLHAISAANAVGGSVTAIVLGESCGAVAKEIGAVKGVGKVVVAESAVFKGNLAENVAPAIVAAHNQFKFTHIAAPATAFGKNIMPRVSAMLDVGQISDVMSVVSADTFTRPIYAGNAIATVQSADPIKVMTVRSTAFPAADASGSTGSVENMTAGSADANATYVSAALAKSDRPELASARIVVSGGRALKSGENFEILYKLADKLNAGVGASRAAVDAGYVPNDMQIGQTGKIIAPELYVAVGISGAIQHLAGMKDSKVIVAINKDPDAPIFQVADYGLVADLFTAVPDLTSKI